MKNVSDTKWGCGFVVLLFVAYLGWCYLEVAKQQRYAPKVAEAMADIPAARLVSSFKSGDLMNPVSWFWAPTTRLVYARPDRSVPSPRFFVMSFLEARDCNLRLIHALSTRRSRLISSTEADPCSPR